jgi:hypothetical protein
VFFLSGWYRKKPGIKVRPVNEWRSCVVFTPDQPNLYLLNLNAWLILELCDGKTAEDLELTYRQAVRQQLSAGETRLHLMQGLNELEKCGIIERCARRHEPNGDPTAKGTTNDHRERSTDQAVLTRS